MAAGDDDWDLSAVVRSCNNSAVSAADRIAAATAEEAALSYLASLTFDDDLNDVAFSFSDILQPKHPDDAFQELHQAFMSFLPAAAVPAAIPAVAVVPAAAPAIPNKPTRGRHSRQGVKPIRPQPAPGTAAAAALQQHRPPAYPPELSNSRVTYSHTPKSRKRKNQQKRMVCHVTAENLSTDMWAWRKYGQKPIKGSPYPRNYYRCSSSKGCGARKQVERSYADPETFIITYTGDHTHPRPTHRNSLAGSSRNRSSSSSIPTRNPMMGDHPDPFSPVAAAALVTGSYSSPVTPINEDDTEKERMMFEHMTIDSDDDDDDDDDILIPNLTARNEIYVGLEADLGCSSRRRTSV